MHALDKMFFKHMFMILIFLSLFMNFADYKKSPILILWSDKRLKENG